jgi:adenylosuccinate synthase
MSAVVIVGAQWGDEGKGKVVDLLSESVDLVVRYAGGPNAGHTLVVGDQRVVLRLIPSGALHGHTRCILGQGMVVNPKALLEEVDELDARGVSLAGRLFVSELSHLILPYHLLVDGLREGSDSGTRIGTTKRGIGPCYEDKIGRRGVRANDLRDAARLRRRVDEALAAWAPTIRELGGEVPAVEPMIAELLQHATRIVPLLADASRVVEVALDEGKRALFEGAQGTLLDIDHGSYPYVTSSSAVAGGACIGAGVGPMRITKAYTTRVGEGPFPTEDSGDVGKRLRDAGDEYGSVTRRPRRTGWLDLPLLRYAKRVNGLSALAVTKLDVLRGIDPIRVCVAYRTAAGETRDLPVASLETAQPIYRELPRWDAPIDACRSLTDLPEAARRYLELIEAETGVPQSLVSVGPRRDQTITAATS